MFKAKYLLILICILFLSTRLYKIGEIPVSVYWDEASIGYNAYSISETGRDEWGESFPIHFRAFGEFKLPVYIYATAVSVKMFGLNEFSVRFPAVLFSLGTVVLSYFLAKKLSGNVRIGLLSSFFVSVSPWFFIFSRTGYESTAGLMFYLLAIIIFLEYKKNSWYILFSIASFTLSMYSYNSFRIISPLTILVLTTYDLKNIIAAFKNNILIVILSGIILAVSVIPIYRLYRYDAGNSRLQIVGATSSSFINNYLSHFNADFLFFHGDNNLRSQQSNFGQLLLPELIFLLLGFAHIVRSKSKYNYLPLIFLILGPIPAAITKEVPHALRAISMVPFFAIISAGGVLFLGKLFGNRTVVNLAVMVITLIFFINYFLNYLNTYPAQSLQDWQYGYKRIFTDYKDEFDKYDRVIISDEYAQPYIFALFYEKINPDKFRQTVIRNNVSEWGFSTVLSFDKFEFGKTDQLIDLKSGNSLIFANNEEKIRNLTLLGDIKLPDKTTLFWIYKQ